MRARPVMFSVSTGLRLCGIADEPFWPGEKIFLGLQHFGALQMADFDRQPFQRRCDHAQGRKEHRMTVARDDLGRHRLDRSPIALATCSSTRGSILAKVPTAPEMAQVAISSRAVTSRSAPG